MSKLYSLYETLKKQEINKIILYEFNIEKKRKFIQKHIQL